MYRKISLALAAILLLGTGSPKAQSVAQLLTQLRLDIEKLAEMRAILAEMYQGYQIVEKGCSEVRDIARGNFNLHKLFLDGLLAVSPVVREYPRVGEILVLGSALVRDYQRAQGRVDGIPGLSVGERAGIRDIYSSIYDQAAGELNRLISILADGELRMSDGERLQAIDGIDDRIGRQYHSLQELDREVQLRALQRQKELDNLSTLKNLYNGGK